MKLKTGEMALMIYFFALILSIKRPLIPNPKRIIVAGSDVTTMLASVPNASAGAIATVVVKSKPINIFFILSPFSR